MTAGDTIRLAINGRTDIGQVRDENEDQIGWYNHPAQPFGYVVIADGMGGYTGGATASMLTTDRVGAMLRALAEHTFFSCTPDQQLLMIQARVMDALNAANRDILNAKSVNPQLANMGSTVVLAIIWRDTVTLAHLGDSRAYLWNRDGLMPMTRDHSLVQEMIDSGSLSQTEARSSKVRNHITRALGVTDFIEPDINSYRLAQNSLLMLCTDGLTEYLDDDEIEHVLSTHRPALECCYRFINEANARGGKDNISVGIVEYTLRAEETRTLQPLNPPPADDVTLRQGANA